MRIQAFSLAVLSLTACGPNAELGDAGSDARRETDALGADAFASDANAMREDAYAPPVDAPGPDAGPSDLTFIIDTTRDVHPISPLIYGINGDGSDAPHPEVFTFHRSGGNRMTAYNWENNASNAGNDYFFQNDDFLGGGDTPGEVPRSFIASVHARAASLVTIPIIGYVAADKRGGGDVNATPDFIHTRFRASLPRSPGAPDTTPDTADSNVYQDAHVAFLEGAFPGAHADTAHDIFYSLDNEPDLWDGTHQRIREGSGAGQLTYAELLDRSVAYASMIHDIAPAARVFGPVSYGYAGYMNLQAAPDAGGREFLDAYLMRMAAEEARVGARLVDVLDLHWYPEIDRGGQPIEGDASTGDLPYWRMQAPRSLWDATFSEPGWISRDVLGGPVRLIPWVKEKITRLYPGTELAFTEYYYGGGDHISGAVAQADVLGVFADQGVFAASLWHLGETNDRFIHGAFEMYRRLDASGTRFGDTSVHAETSDIERSSVHASVDGAGRVIIVAINRSDAPLSVTMQIQSARTLGNASVVRLSAASPTPMSDGTLTPIGHNGYRATLPGPSVTTFVVIPE